jgi:hypothetical protein
MVLNRAGWAGVALACALTLGVPSMVRAQDHDAGAQTNDSQGWQAPRGYDEAYPENGTPNMVARQGFAAGFNQGTADAARGKKFKPTESDAYEHATIPKGMDKEAFRQDFREAFVKGYTSAYKKDKD